jgi:uncharacterized protein YbaR (Trm112 family)
MAISKELLEILVCPICKAVVTQADSSGSSASVPPRVSVATSPVMLVDEAQVEE